MSFNWADLGQWFELQAKARPPVNYFVLCRALPSGIAYYDRAVYDWHLPAFPSRSEIYQEMKRFAQKAQRDCDDRQEATPYVVLACPLKGKKPVGIFLLGKHHPNLVRKRTLSEKKRLDAHRRNDEKRRICRELLELEKENQIMTKVAQRKIRELFRRGAFRDFLKGLQIKREIRAKARKARRAR